MGILGQDYSAVPYIPETGESGRFSLIYRKEVLFYHETVESAIDHFLQVLFALNKCFFPSRKRTIQYIDTFNIKPAKCTERLLQTIELGAKPETLSQSYDVWLSLYKDLLDLANLIGCS